MGLWHGVEHWEMNKINTETRTELFVKSWPQVQSFKGKYLFGVILLKGWFQVKQQFSSFNKFLSMYMANGSFLLIAYFNFRSCATTLNSSMTGPTLWPGSVLASPCSQLSSLGMSSVVSQSQWIFEDLRSSRPDFCWKNSLDFVIKDVIFLYIKHSMYLSLEKISNC